MLEQRPAAPHPHLPSVLRTAAHFCARTHQWTAACFAVERLVRVLRAVHCDAHESLTMPQTNMAVMLQNQGRIVEAEAAYLRALENCQRPGARVDGLEGEILNLLGFL